MTNRRALFLSLVAGLLLTSEASALSGYGRRTSSTASAYTFPWRFAYVTDAHLGWPAAGLSPRSTYQFGHAIDSMSVAGIDFLILGGDYAEDILHGGGFGDESSDSLTAIMARSRFQWWPIVGNHETVTDTATTEPPAYAIARFPSFYGARTPYYVRDWKNLRFVSLDNCVNYDVNSTADYLLNNPFGNGAEVPGRDFYGMGATSGTQRTWLRAQLAGRNKNRWLIVGQHRQNYGSDRNASSRHNWNSGPLRGTGYIKEIEDSLKTDERGIILAGDHHLPLWFTVALRDSTKATATGKGLYHISTSAAGAARQADSTEAISGAWLQAALFADPDGTNNLNGHTSTTWSDALAFGDDPDWQKTWCWQLFTVWGDAMMVETFRVYTSRSAGATGYNGAGHSRLIDRRMITRDTQ